MKDCFNARCMVASVTPFNSAKEVDEVRLIQHTNRLIEQGIDAIVALGTTSEWPTLTSDEQERVLELTIQTVNSRVPVIAGVGSFNTVETASLANEAMEMGADGVMVVTPYYNVPDQRGLYEHFSWVANAAASAPIMLYNVPHRTGVDLLPSTCLELMQKHENIKAIKEAIITPQRLLEYQKVIQHFADGSRRWFAGNDIGLKTVLDHGGYGIVSVAANLYTELFSTLTNQYSDATSTVDLTERWEELATVLGVLEQLPNPQAIKFAMAQAGYLENELRLPLSNYRVGENVKFENDLAHALTFLPAGASVANLSQSN